VRASAPQFQNRWNWLWCIRYSSAAQWTVLGVVFCHTVTAKEYRHGVTCTSAAERHAHAWCYIKPWPSLKVVPHNIITPFATHHLGPILRTTASKQDFISMLWESMSSRSDWSGKVISSTTGAISQKKAEDGHCSYCIYFSYIYFQLTALSAIEGSIWLTELKTYILCISSKSCFNKKKMKTLGASADYEKCVL